MSDFLNELEQCIPALRRYAYTLLYQQDQADDLVQDCLERAIKKQALWQEGTSLRAWLFTMQHNLYVNRLKKIGRQPLMTEETETLTHSLEPHKADTLMHDIDFCMRQLPEDQRQIILLVTVQGFSYKEVGQIINVPFMSRLSRGRKTLQALMSGDSSPTQPALRSVK